MFLCIQQIELKNCVSVFLIYAVPKILVDMWKKAKKHDFQLESRISQQRKPRSKIGDVVFSSIVCLHKNIFCVTIGLVLTAR